MTQEEFIYSVRQHLFIQGFNCANQSKLAKLAQEEMERLGCWPEPESFAGHCQALAEVSERARTPNGILASPTAGASKQWLAVHEAGHAIVGIDADFCLFGVRFFGDNGFPGETGFEDHEWQNSEDQDLLQGLIRVDVAGNMAELLFTEFQKRDGRLSGYYDNRTEGLRPTDFIFADERAVHLARVQTSKTHHPATDEELWATRRAIVELAEVEAQEILDNTKEVIDRLANQLRLGPMTGANIRQLLKGM